MGLQSNLDNNLLAANLKAGRDRHPFLVRIYGRTFFLL